MGLFFMSVLSEALRKGKVAFSFMIFRKGPMSPKVRNSDQNNLYLLDRPTVSLTAILFIYYFQYTTAWKQSYANIYVLSLP